MLLIAACDTEYRADPDNYIYVLCEMLQSEDETPRRHAKYSWANLDQKRSFPEQWIFLEREPVDINILVATLYLIVRAYCNYICI